MFSPQKIKFMLQLLMGDLAECGWLGSGGCNFGYLHFISPVNKNIGSYPLMPKRRSFLQKIFQKVAENSLNTESLKKFKILSNM
nr:MAG TPA: hypothetical protein [Caudoviricetes sp.]